VKLARHFYRLPVRFDVNRLRAEVEALPADAWSRHPSEYTGNTAARLITVGGGQNDFTAGEMQPTPALAASPYIQQVLASFSTVWSRSRLMRIEGGGSVPQHSDMNHHSRPRHGERGLEQRLHDRELRRGHLRGHGAVRHRRAPRARPLGRPRRQRIAGPRHRQP
jgi:hypothetical protein